MDKASVRASRAAAIALSAFTLLSGVSATAGPRPPAACEHPAPPPRPPVGERCMQMPLPTDGRSLGDLFPRPLAGDPSYPYAAFTTPPVCYDNHGHFTRWRERRAGQPYDGTYERRFVFQRPKYAGSLALPLVIWAHPRGPTETFAADGYINLLIAQEALRHGFAFMSVQYRHPTQSRPWEAPQPPPADQLHDGESPSPFCAWESTDIAAAIQFAGLHAEQLHIRREDIFLVGQSLGSLTVLTATMPDQIDGTRSRDLDYRAWSSKPSAVFAANAAVTYDHAQNRELFMRGTATIGETAAITAKPLQFPLCRGPDGLFDYHCQYDKADIVVDPKPTNPLSALDTLDSSDPPIWLRYDRRPSMEDAVLPLANYVADAGTDQTWIHPADCYDLSGYGCLDVHSPNFGLALRNAYLALPSGDGKAYVNVQYAATHGEEDRDRAGRNFWNGYHCFFIGYRTAAGVTIHNMTPGGRSARAGAVRRYAANRRDDLVPPDPPATSARECLLDESQPWNWQLNP